MSAYRPGVCNIGRRQRRRRAGLAVAAFLVAVAIVGASLLGWIPEVLLAGVFVPLVLGFEWAIQAHEAFCVRLALFGRYDFRADGGDTAGRVAAAEDRRRDRVRAVEITVVSLLFAAGATAALVVAL